MMLKKRPELTFISYFFYFCGACLGRWSKNYWADRKNFCFFHGGIIEIIILPWFFLDQFFLAGFQTMNTHCPRISLAL
jgi:hypothetical protein